ncbi:unnamed protein product [Oikopleura dioica]|uniref:HSF-type DNA-binding domain-containing protein n=1 Tax=Oikopleura dioica TaxID=34765 RepID=E4YA44_OIKDI|nr:unnamed protein product [Oikopleura dioica]
MKDSSEENKLVENVDQTCNAKKSSGKKQGGLEKWLKPKEAAAPALRRTTRKRTAPKVFGDLVPSKQIPKSKKAGPKPKVQSTSPKTKEAKAKKPPKAKKEASSKNIPKEPKKDEIEKKRKGGENAADEPKQKRGRRPKTKTVKADLSDAEQGLKQSNITALFAKKNSAPKDPENKSQPSAKNVAESAEKTPAATSLPKTLQKPDPTADVDKLLQQIAEYNEEVKTEPVDEEEVIRREIAENNKRIEELNMGLKTAFELFCRNVLKYKAQMATLSKAEIQPFVSKLFEILNDDQFPSIAWNSTGDHFIIEREAFDHQFLKLSKEEKAPIQTKEFPSFIRQLNLYGFRKRREETGSDPNYFSHYVHKDGFFQKDRQDLLIHILRSGSSREKGKFHRDFFFFHDFIFSSVILEKQGEVTEAREQLMQEKGAQGQSHYDPEQRAVPLCQEYVLSPQDMARRMANESDNQEIPTEAETEIASQNNGFYQKPNGQWAQHPSWLLNNLPQYGDPMMAHGDWINSEPGIDGQQSSAQGPIQYNIANMAADFAGQMSTSLSVELPLGLRTPINQAMDFSTYGDMPPMTESNQQPLGDPVLSNIVNKDTNRDALTTNITNWLRTLPDKGQGTSSEEFFASMSKASASSKKPSSQQSERPKTPEGESPFDF